MYYPIHVKIITFCLISFVHIWDEHTCHKYSKQTMGTLKVSLFHWRLFQKESLIQKPSISLDFIHNFFLVWSIIQSPLIYNQLSGFRIYTVAWSYIIQENCRPLLLTVIAIEISQSLLQPDSSACVFLLMRIVPYTGIHTVHIFSPKYKLCLLDGQHNVQIASATTELWENI